MNNETVEEIDLENSIPEQNLSKIKKKRDILKQIKYEFNYRNRISTSLFAGI